MGQWTWLLHQRRRHLYSHHQRCTVLHSLPVSSATLPFISASYLWLIILVFVTCGTLFTVAEGKPLTDVTSSVERHQVLKRGVTDGSVEGSGYADYQSGVRYDEYPVSTSRLSIDYENFRLLT